jgi:light-regulated signal transduction histidine kinase (bacteriophytochrome)
LRKAVDTVLSSLAATIEAAHARIDCGMLPVLRINEVHLQQLLQNLISNALKYRGQQPPFIQIGAERSGQHWKVRVADNGIGIDPLNKDRIFEPFKRLHNAEEYPGTGIGLALCQKIVQRYGGHIWVESALGKGSSFFFTVPIGVASALTGKTGAGLRSSEEFLNRHFQPDSGTLPSSKNTLT